MGAAKGLTRLFFGDSPRRERRSEAMLGGGWILMSVAVGGIYGNVWVSVLAVAVGLILSGILSVYGEARKTEKNK